MEDARQADLQQCLCRARNLVARQGAIVRCLERREQPAEAARNLLATLEVSLFALLRYRDTLKHVSQQQRPDNQPRLG